MANIAGENILKDFKPSGTRYAMAVRLTGKFKTAYPAGKPEDKKDEDKKEGDKKEEKPAVKKPDDSLKQSAQDNSVILVADADFLGDGVAVERVQTFFGAALVSAMAIWPLPRMRGATDRRQQSDCRPQPGGASIIP